MTGVSSWFHLDNDHFDNIDDCDDNMSIASIDTTADLGRVNKSIFDSDLICFDGNEKLNEESNTEQNHFVFGSRTNDGHSIDLSKGRKRSSKKKMWTKPKGMPKRPMSAYNLFFQLERERLIQNDSDGDNNDDNKVFTAQDVDRIVKERKILDKKPKPKRKHRKTHGKISFGEMARVIAKKWKKLDQTQKCIFTERATIEKYLYTKDVKEWSTLQQQNNTSNKSNNKSDNCDYVSIAASTPEKSKHIVVPSETVLSTNLDWKPNPASTRHLHGYENILNEEYSLCRTLLNNRTECCPCESDTMDQHSASCSCQIFMALKKLPVPLTYNNSMNRLSYHLRDKLHRQQAGAYHQNSNNSLHQYSVVPTNITTYPVCYASMPCHTPIPES